MENGDKRETGLGFMVLDFSFSKKEKRKKKEDLVDI